MTPEDVEQARNPPRTALVEVISGKVVLVQSTPDAEGLVKVAPLGMDGWWIAHVNQLEPLDVYLERRLAERNRAIQQEALLERMADALELQAIISAQVSVPDHVGAKLDPWRDEILKRMAERYKARTG